MVPCSDASVHEPTTAAVDDCRQHTGSVLDFVFFRGQTVTIPRTDNTKPQQGAIWQRWREAFPIAERFIHLDIANKAPLPSTVIAALDAFLAEHALGPGDKDTWKARVEAVRRRLARLIGVTAGEIAFTRNTSEGLNIAAQAIDWRGGDNVVTHAREHPNNLYTWLHLRHRGVEVRIAGGEERPIAEADIEALVDSRTRAVAVSAVSYCTGQRLDLPRLAAACRKVGALLVVDAVQALGVVSLDMAANGIDLMASGCQKGLLSVHGIGLLYCRAAVLDQLTPPFAARTSMARLDPHASRLPYRADAQRFEYGNLNYAGIHALAAALDLIEDAGIEAIEGHIGDLTDALIVGLTRAGLEVLTPKDRRCRAGIVAVRLAESARVAQRLLDHGIIVSAQDGALRVAPHAYTTQAELTAFLGALRDVVDMT